MFFHPPKVQITKAEVRLDDGWHRLFVTIDGVEWLIPCAKDIMLAQGLTLAPEAWTGPLGERYIFTDLRDEDSPSEVVEGIIDPVLVGLAIRASRSDKLGSVPIPSEAQAHATIRRLCRNQMGMGCYPAARSDSA